MSTQVKKFVFGPFQENTYVVYDSSKECVIIDPGCFTTDDENELKMFIENNELKPVRVLLTHSHIDHIFGTEFTYKTWGLLPEVHPKDEFVYNSFQASVIIFQLSTAPTPPEPKYTLKEGEDISFGNTRFKVHFVPGHCPGHVAFECEESNFIIAGDVLFFGSIGRTDLPGGDYDTLIDSIKSVLFKLDLNRTVYCGHGPETSLLREKQSNPFLVEG